MTREELARITAGVIAAAVLLAFVPPMAKALDRGESVLEAVWGLLRWFTIITNLLVGLVFARLAWRGPDSLSPRLVGGVMLAIVLVGAVFNLLLPAPPHATLWDRLGDHIHHVAAPILVPLWWAAFIPHGRLRWSAPLVWALYPLGYIAYTFARVHLAGPGDGIRSRYPYFFMDIDRFGLSTVALYIAAIAAGFLLAGLLAVAIDRRLASAETRPVRT